ncbi:MAG: HAMP domain-containing protein [Hyphomicrobium sp.]
MTLRRRLSIMIGLVLFATLWLGAIMTYWHALQKVDVEMSAALAHGRESISEALVGIAKTDSPTDEIERLIKTFNHTRHLRAILVRPDRTVVASRPTEVANDVPRWFVRLLDIPPSRVKIDLPDQLISAGGLLLEADPRNEISEVWDDVRLKLVILGGFCLAVLASLTWMLDWALRPLDRLLAGFEKVGRGDYSAKLQAEQLPEFERISKGFNDMTRLLDDLRRRNAALDEQLATVQDEERAELARDLHDEISPLLFGVEVDAKSIAAMVDGDKPHDADIPRVGERAHAILSAAIDMKAHIRQLLNRLRPEAELGLGLPSAIRHLASTYEMRHHDIALALHLDHPGWNQPTNALLYAIVREGLSNAVKHAEPHRIRIRMCEHPDGHAVVEIADDGRGRAIDAEPGYGHISMRERIDRAGGSLSVSRDPNLGGVHITASIPLQPAPRAQSLPSRDLVTVSGDRTTPSRQNREERPA